MAAAVGRADRDDTLMERPLHPKVQRALDDFPGISLVRAHQIARDRDGLLRRRAVPALTTKWVAP